MQAIWNVVWSMVRPILDAVFGIGYKILFAFGANAYILVLLAIVVLILSLAVWWSRGVVFPETVSSFKAKHPMAYQTLCGLTVLLQAPVWLVVFMGYWGVGMKTVNAKGVNPILSDVIELSFLFVPIIFGLIWWGAASIQSNRLGGVKPATKAAFFASLMLTPVVCWLSLLLVGLLL